MSNKRNHKSIRFLSVLLTLALLLGVFSPVAEAKMSGATLTKATAAKTGTRA